MLEFSIQHKACNSRKSYTADATFKKATNIEGENATLVAGISI